MNSIDLTTSTAATNKQQHKHERNRDEQQKEQIIKIRVGSSRARRCRPARIVLGSHLGKIKILDHLMRYKERWPCGLTRLVIVVVVAVCCEQLVVIAWKIEHIYEIGIVLAVDLKYGRAGIELRGDLMVPLDGQEAVSGAVANERAHAVRLTKVVVGQLDEKVAQVVGIE